VGHRRERRDDLVARRRGGGMSRGYGRIQRRIIEVFEKLPDKLIGTSTLVCLVHDRSVEALYKQEMPFPFDKSEVTAVRRALRGLVKDGKIKCWGRGWRHDNEARWSSPDCSDSRQYWTGR
jgi:hypothetical protein